MKLSEKFPKAAGWITAKLTVKKGENFTEEDARQFMSFGKPHTCQFGLIETNRNPVKIIYREIRKAAIDPDAQPVVSPLVPETLPSIPVPFIASCGNLIVEVQEAFSKWQQIPMPMLRVIILRGRHFNNSGDYGPGEEVNIGPLSEHWKILTFPDSVTA